MKKILCTLLAVLFTVILAGCVQPPHEHTLVEVPRVEAEVGKDGNIEYWECTDCGKLFADAQGETEIAREDTVIPALEEPESPFTLADVYSWTGRNYPASEFTFGYNGTEEVTFTYDETALTLDAEAHTVKALKDGRFPVTVSAGGSTDSFTVIGKSVNRVGYRWQGDINWYKELAGNSADLYKGEGTDGKTTVFIGDSFFDGTNFWTNFDEIYAGKDAQVAGISSTTTYDWEQIMLDRVFLHNMNPKNIVMDIGTNNFYDDGDSTDMAIESVQRMFTLMHDKMPETHIWYFSVAQRTNTSYRQNVSDLNDAMQAWCADKDWITFIDVEDLMTAEYIRPADGVHPTLDAYVDVYAAQLEKAGCVIEDK